jgi:hypothetical protein
MGLNLGGMNAPHIRYEAQTASWKLSGEGGLQGFQFTQAVFDLHAIRTGWLRIDMGMAPQWVFDPSISNIAPMPQGEGWKRGFCVNLFSPSIFGGNGVREWQSNAVGATQGIAALYDAFLSSVPDDRQSPVVEFTGAEHKKFGKGTTSIPNFKIVKFIPTPDGLLEARPLPVANDNAPQGNVGAPSPSPAPEPGSAASAVDLF